MPSRLKQLPEGVEESYLFSAYASDCVYDERKVELWRRKWRDISVKERPHTACDTRVLRWRSHIQTSTQH